MLYVRRMERVGAPSVWILHGLLGMGDNWLSIARSLSADYTLTLPDLRNHGRSFHANTHHFADMAMDIMRLMDAQKEAAIHVIGHSMGGKVAMHLALHAPRRVRSLCVVDIGARAYAMKTNAAVIEAMLAAPLAACAERRHVDEALKEAFPVNSMRAFVLKNLYRTETGGRFAWRSNLQVLRAHLDALGAAIEAPPQAKRAKTRPPALLIKGSRSDYVSQKDVEAMRDLFPGLQTETLPAGHWVHADAPAQTLAVLKRWLAANTKKGS